MTFTAKYEVILLYMPVAERVFVLSLLALIRLIFSTVEDTDGNRTNLSRALFGPKPASSKAAGAYAILHFGLKKPGVVSIDVKEL